MHHTELATTRSRRDIIRSGMLTGGALIAGIGATGTVAGGRFNDAPGRGGMAVVPEEDFKREPFTINHRSGGDESKIGGILFRCAPGGDQVIFLVGWEFQYDEEPETRYLYTRSNNIDVEEGYTFTWGSGGKTCDDGIRMTFDPGFVPPEDENPNPEGTDFTPRNGVMTPFNATGDQ